MFKKLSNYQKELMLGRNVSNGYVKGGERRVFLNPRWIKQQPDNFIGGGDDEDEEYLDMELAAIDADMARNGHKIADIKNTKFMTEPLAPGYYSTMFDPDHVTPTDKLKDAKLMAKRVEKTADIKDYYDRVIKPEIAAGEARRYDAEYGDKELADQDVVKFTKLLFSMPKTEKDKLYDEMMADARTDNEKNMIKALFSGKAAYPNFKDLNSLIGIDTGQTGKTGSGTENADKYINLKLLMMCELLNIAADECDVMRKTIRRESPQSMRDARAAIRKPMLEAILDEIDDKDAANLKRKFGIEGRIPDPNVRKEKKAFDKFVIMTFYAVVLMATPDEVKQLKGMFEDFRNNSQIRKWKNLLNNNDNYRYQQLVGVERDYPGQLAKDDLTELWQLEFMRHGMDHDGALKAAEEIVKKPDADKYSDKTNNVLTQCFGNNIWHKGVLKNKTDHLMRRFLRGGSGNAKL